VPITAFAARSIGQLALLPLALLLFGCEGRSSPALSASATLGQRLDRMAGDFREEFNVPALQLGVIKNGQPVYAGAVGVRRLGTDEAITDRSVFHMASVSKPFVAMALAQLADRGRLSLDDRVVQHLPYFRLRDDRYRSITIEQVLAHVSGLPDLADYEWDKPQYDGLAAERYVRSLSNLELTAAPGERFLYSNIGYDILGDVIAKASGRSFEAFVKESIFTPLGMSDSTFLRAEVPASLSVWPHRRGISTFFLVRPARVYPYNRAHAPSSTLHSNVGDMLRFCQAMLDTGSVAKTPIVGPGSRSRMWTPHANQGLADGEKAEWMGAVGLGWFVGSYKGHRMISSVGADPGFRATVALLPDDAIAVVCMGNSDTMRVGRLARAALDLALE
jgi:CubicO group peptidase (beta-lactamase class C family)